jgi:thiamine biosynthesis protein ThiI
MYIESNEIDIIVDKLKCIFGIHSIVRCYRINSDIEEIKDKSLELLNNISFKTFKVETNRAYKLFTMNRMEVNRTIGSYILKNNDNIKVDGNDPE